MYVVHTYIGYKNRTRSRTNLSQNVESYQSIDDTCVFWVLGMLLEWKNLTHPRVSGFLGLYRGERVIKYGLNRVFREPLISLKMLQWQSKLLIALIAKRNSAFIVTEISEIWTLSRHKKCGVKTFYCSHCNKKFVLFLTIWRHEDTKSMVSKLFIALILIRSSSFLTIWRHDTQKIWCQNFLLLSLW